MPDVRIYTVDAENEVYFAEVDVFLMSTSASTPAYVNGGRVISKVATKNTADSAGLATFSLPANSTITTPANTYYRFTIKPGAKHKAKTGHFQVPNTAGPFDVEDILYESPAAVETPALSAHIATVKHHTDWSDTVPETGQFPLWNGTAWEPSDTAATDAEAAGLVAAEAAIRGDADDALAADIAVLDSDLTAEETTRANHAASLTNVHGFTDTYEVEHGNLTQDLIGRRHVPYEHTFDRPLFVICDDDNDDTGTYVATELEERGLVGTYAHAWEFYSDNGAAATKMTLADAKALQDKGHELVAHSRSHEAITDWAHFVDEAVNIQALMEAQNLRCDSHKDPGPWTGDQEFDSHAKTLSRYGRLMRRYFVVHSGYDQGTSYNYTRPFPMLDTYGPGAALTVDASDLTTLQAAVDRAIEYNGICYVAGHFRNLDQPGSLTRADFETFLDYVQTQVEAGKMYSVTLTQAFRARRGPRENLLRDEFFEDSATGSYVHWSVASPGGGAPPISDASTWAVGDSVTVDSTNNLWQQMRADNLRTVEFACKARRDDTGVAATLRVNFRHVDSTGTSVLNSNRDVAIGADAAGEEIRGIYTRLDPRAVRLIVRIATTSAAKVRVAEPALMPA